MGSSSREIIKKLKKDSWYEVAHECSHKQFKHPTRAGRVTVKHPVKDVKIGTIKSIERQSGTTLR